MNENQLYELDKNILFVLTHGIVSVSYIIYLDVHNSSEQSNTITNNQRQQNHCILK